MFINIIPSMEILRGAKSIERQIIDERMRMARSKTRLARLGLRLLDGAETVPQEITDGMRTQLSAQFVEGQLELIQLKSQREEDIFDAQRLSELLVPPAQRQE